MPEVPRMTTASGEPLLTFPPTDAGPNWIMDSATTGAVSLLDDDALADGEAPTMDGRTNTVITTAKAVTNSVKPRRADQRIDRHIDRSREPSVVVSILASSDRGSGNYELLHSSSRAERLIARLSTTTATTTTPT